VPSLTRARSAFLRNSQILVAEGLVCKLGDFGESRDVRDETMTTVRARPHLYYYKYSVYVRVLTPSPARRSELPCTGAIAATCLLFLPGHTFSHSSSHSAPEILRSELYDESADAFSFAVTLVACFKDDGRGYGDDLFSIGGVKHSGLRPSIPEWDPATQSGCPERVAELVRKCWSEDAMERLPLSRVVQELEAELERIADTDNNKEEHPKERAADQGALSLARAALGAEESNVDFFAADSADSEDDEDGGEEGGAAAGGGGAPASATPPR